jgi:hypothetical protein
VQTQIRTHSEWSHNVQASICEIEDFPKRTSSTTAEQRPRQNTRLYALLGSAVGAVPKANYGIRLRSLLALNNIELDLIALFERFVPVQLNCGVMNEYIWPVFTSDESVALGVVKPLHLTLVLSHRFLPSFWGIAESW